MSILVAEKLSKSYSGFQAVRDVSFALEAGEILALIGMGEVWKLIDTRLNREVAIKFSQAQFSDRFTDRRLRIYAFGT